MNESTNEVSQAMTWLASANVNLTIENYGDKPLKTVEQLMYIIFRLHSELGSDRKVRFQIEVVE